MVGREGLEAVGRTPHALWAAVTGPGDTQIAFQGKVADIDQSGGVAGRHVRLGIDLATNQPTGRPGWTARHRDAMGGHRRGEPAEKF